MSQVQEGMVFFEIGSLNLFFLCVKTILWLFICTVVRGFDNVRCASEIFDDHGDCDEDDTACSQAGE